MGNYPQIKKKYLLFREDAKNLAELIHKKNKVNKLSVILLDFSHVNFMSRSFIDEFINILNQLSGEGIKVKITHLNPLLNYFVSRVKKTKNKIQSILAFESKE